MTETINLNCEIDKSIFNHITKYINEIIEKETTKEFLNSAAQENKNKGEN